MLLWRLNPMNKFRSHTFFKHLVVFFSLTYLFCSLTSIFLIPRATPVFTKTSPFPISGIRKHILDKSNHTASYILITDRTILDDDQLNVRSAPIIYLVIFGGFILFYILLNVCRPPLLAPLNKQYSYLSFRTIRI